jgi:hypothetical protein
MIKVPKNYKRLQQMVNKAVTAMLDTIPNDTYDDEFHYVITRVQLRISHMICSGAPLPKEEDEDDLR